MPNIDPTEEKRLIKEAIKEWMTEQYAQVGKWAIFTMLASAFFGLVYLALVGMGWHK